MGNSGKSEYVRKHRVKGTVWKEKRKLSTWKGKTWLIQNDCILHM